MIGYFGGILKRDENTRIVLKLVVLKGYKQHLDKHVYNTMKN